MSDTSSADGWFDDHPSTESFSVSQSLREPPAALWILRGAPLFSYPAGRAVGWEAAGAVLPVAFGESGSWRGSEVASGPMEVIHASTLQIHTHTSLIHTDTFM